ncbi:putative ornithine decarboxylase [Aspergillus uvarum CBS 121591]|uniref:ornithine decarboxylase n=1 Tax=Aspergillus uvarum CBS 121591 TaxID=1448315 RepID=A0A319BW95_9EURO|nr:putative ornithine decarboxylase [Aspergillus uvarum CBS 121591]PYH75630.1 putative ornithine decarboxylase [Aspergillus uvarum CBS 121591]
MGVCGWTACPRLVDHLRTVGENGPSFFVGNLAAVVEKLDEWNTQLPFVKPFYAVKCNDNKTLLALLAGKGLGFDCASQKEMQQILQCAVDPEDIIFASPQKAENHILYAHEQRIQKTVVDSEEELRKLARLAPSMKVFLRLQADDPTARVRLSKKYGMSFQEAIKLLAIARDLSVSIVGICFHVGSAASNPAAYFDAIAMCRQVLDFNNSLASRHAITAIDVGGGFTAANFRRVAQAIRSAKAKYFGEVNGMQWMAEPGRFIASEAFSLVCRVTGIRSRPNASSPSNKVHNAEIFVNDGIYQNFLNALVEGEKSIPTPVLLHCNGNSDRSVPRDGCVYTIWGQTCCSADKIKTACSLCYRVEEGDWLCFPSMGAYTQVTASGFNGFSAVTPIIWIPSAQRPGA